MGKGLIIDLGSSDPDTMPLRGALPFLTNDQKLRGINPIFEHNIPIGHILFYLVGKMDKLSVILSEQCASDKIFTSKTTNLSLYNQ